MRGRGDVAGAGLAAAAYALWGLFPVYFKAVAGVPAVEVLAHRVVWSVVVLAALIAVVGGWAKVRRILASRRVLATLTASALLLSLNWGVFIWAVAKGRVLECSLGYFINPLVSVVLAIVVLGERLRALQWLAVGLAALGVAHQVVRVGGVPWVALTLALSFGLYGLIRKLAPADALTGLFVETASLTPVALVYLLWLAANGEGAFGHAGLVVDGLLILAGPVTALPLLLFVAGARRIELVTAGLLQYIAPTGHFLLAVLAYGEPFTTTHLITFAAIWLALALYTASVLGQHRRR